MTTRSLLLLLIALAAALVPGCRRGAGEDARAEGVVRLGYFASLAHAQAVLGVASGDFAKAALPARLETRVFNAGPSLVEALFAGQIDVGYVGPGPAITAHARSRGRGIRVVAGASANGVVVVARKGSGVATFADLAGRRIATPELGGTQDVSARHFTIAALGQPNADTILPIANAEQPALMARGEIDAAWVPEPWGERLVRETGARIVAEEKDLWPRKEHLLGIVVTTPEFLAAHRDVVKRLVDAHAAWTARLAADAARHVPGLAAALEGLTGKRLSADLLLAATSRVKYTTALGDDGLEAYGRWTHELGFERAPTDVRGLVDASLLPEVRAEAR